jgi:hypothetical protein
MVELILRNNDEEMLMIMLTFRGAEAAMTVLFPIGLTVYYLILSYQPVVD